MPSHSEQLVLSYTPEQLFDLVADVGRYPEFLPWCKAARILKQDEHILTADLIIGYKFFTEKFRSNVMLKRPYSIDVQCVSGPLSHLRNRWEFKPKDKDSCELHFKVDFDFRSSILGGAMEIFFDKAVQKMVAAFEMRAAELYGKRNSA